MENIRVARIAMSERPCDSVGIKYPLTQPDLAIPISGQTTLPFVAAVLCSTNLCVKSISKRSDHPSPAFRPAWAYVFRLVVEPSTERTSALAAWLLIAQSTVFLTITLAVVDCVVVPVALRVFQQLTGF